MTARRIRRGEPTVDALDFEIGTAVIIEPDDDGARPSWGVWHARESDLPGGWLRTDWLQEVEQGFQFGDETAIIGLNWFTDDGTFRGQRLDPKTYWALQELDAYWAGQEVAA